jgi:uncharacterized protein (DUF488 family)
MKCAFLASREHSSVLAQCGYDFVPYKYGPFSFGLYHDLGRLQKSGHVQSTGDEGPLLIRDEDLTRVRSEVESLPWGVRAAIADTVSRYGPLTTDQLLRDVYARFPWYAALSERRDLAPHPVPVVATATPAVYTLGYEGLTVDGLFNLLLLRGVRRILDVRANPVSRRYGFARSSMSGIAGKLGLDYVHLPELGIPSERRRCVRTAADHAELLDWYEKSLPSRAAGVERVSQEMLAEPSVLVCMEADPRICHRGRLALAVSCRTGLPVYHLSDREKGRYDTAEGPDYCKDVSDPVAKV